ncbi:MAG: PorP/SprF family type IX secretion system membrane protein [Marinirhabdus sp.]
MALYSVIALLAAYSVFPAAAQEGLPVYSDYLSDNFYLLHPSMAGAAVHHQVRVTGRQQWFDRVAAPNLQTLAVNARLGPRSGVGGIAIKDANGYFAQSGGYVTYAHHIMFSRDEIDLNQLSFGMSVGLLQPQLDERTFDVSDNDPAILGILRSSSYFNIDVGASYNFLDFSGHVTIKNLLFRNRKNFTKGFEPKNQRRYLISLLYSMGRLGGKWSYEPSFLFQWVARTSEKVADVNFKVFRTMGFGKLWGGVSYRRSFDRLAFLNGQPINNQRLQYVTPFVGTNYKNFLVAYTYSYQTGSIRFENGGFHQLTLGYDFGGRGQRYACNCPAIN